jgi:hypothetical protein
MKRIFAEALNEKHRPDATPRPRRSVKSAKKTERFCCFSTVAGERGAADAERDGLRVAPSGSG